MGCKGISTTSFYQQNNINPGVKIVFFNNEEANAFVTNYKSLQSFIDTIFVSQEFQLLKQHILAPIKNEYEKKEINVKDVDNIPYFQGILRNLVTEKDKDPYLIINELLLLFYNLKEYSIEDGKVIITEKNIENVKEQYYEFIIMFYNMMKQDTAIFESFLYILNDNEHYFTTFDSLYNIFMYIHNSKNLINLYEDIKNNVYLNEKFEKC